MSMAEKNVDDVFIRLAYMTRASAPIAPLKMCIDCSD